MYAAVLEFKFWGGAETYFFMEEIVDAIIEQFEEAQDLDCLVRMGYGAEGKAGQEELAKIAAFVGKYRAGRVTLEDLKAFTFKLSAGSFRCSAGRTGSYWEGYPIGNRQTRRRRPSRRGS